MIKPFQEIIENRHAIAKKWKEENKKGVVGYFCCITPKELIYASGFLPVRITGSSEKLEVVDDYVPRYACGFVRSCLDMAGRGVYDYLDSVVVPNACDLVSKMEYWWRKVRSLKSPVIEGQEVHPDVYYLNFPIKATGRKVAYFYLMQLRHFKQHLERLSGHLISEERLIEALHVYNEHYRLMEQLDEWRKQDPPGVRGSEAWTLEFSSLLIPQHEHNKLMKEYLAEIPKRKEKPSKGIRLYLSASALDQETAKIYQIVEECGGVVVSEDTSAGASHYAGIRLHENRSPLQTMADRSLATPCPHSTVAGTLSSPYPMYRWNYLRKTMDGFHIQGAIFYNLGYCECRALENPFLKKKIKEEMNIPVLFLEGDYTPAGLEQTRGQIETFMEMIGG